MKYYIDTLSNGIWKQMGYQPLSAHEAYIWIAFSANKIDKDNKNGILAVRFRRT